MKRRLERTLLFIVSSTLFLTGCQNKQEEDLQARFYENGSAKPVVALVPLIDSSRHNLSWNLSDEMTALIHYRLMQQDNLYLIDEEKVGGMIKRMKEENNPFGTDLSWMKRAFYENEFVVFMELMRHEQLPLSTRTPQEKDLPQELNMSIRIRVIDLREEIPKIALQEIIQGAHVIPKQFTEAHFTQVEWGQENYPISPIGIAHTKLLKEVASRLEEYILLTMHRNIKHG